MSFKYFKYHPQYLLPLALGIFFTCGIRAQDKQTGIKPDSTVNESELMIMQPATVPGAMFNISRHNSTAAVSTVSGGLLYKTPTANLTNTLYGLLPGLTVSQGSGEPGNDAASLKIRGLSSYNMSSYVVYVDGFQTTEDYFQYLSPAEIESVSILKDAAALATFGMKGANGVIWVTTKRGDAGKPKVLLQVRTGFQQPLHINEPLGSYDYARLYNEAVSNDNGRVWSPAYSSDELQAYQKGTGINTRWYDEVLKKQAPFTTADASVSGGNEAARYFVVLGYLNSQGLYDAPHDDTHGNASLRQFKLRANLDFNLFKIFEGKVDLGGRTDDRRYPNYPTDKLWDHLARYPSNIYPAKNDDGTWPGTNIYPDNPLASIRELGYNSTHDRTLQANFRLKEKLDFLTPGLYLSEAASFNTWTRGSYNVTKNYARMLNGQVQTPDVNSNYSIFDDRGTNQYDWKQFQAQAGYEKEFGKHAITAAVSYLQYMYNVDSNQNGSAGTNIRYGYENIGGRLHYTYDNRISGEFGFASSGSDNYASGNRFGFYPSLSAAWNISNESFFRNVRAISDLKLRASAGKSGFDNFSGGRYLYQLYYNSLGAFPTGNGDPVWHNGLGEAYIPNPEIFAEQSMKYNIGADLGLFHVITVAIDAFIDKRSGIVTQDSSLMQIFGTAPPYENIGKVTNRGFEISINLHQHNNRLSYWAGIMAAYNSNQIDYMAEVPPVTPGLAKTGNSIGTPFGYEFNGFYDITDFNPDGSLKTSLPLPGFGNVQPGDLKYKDLNHDNRIDERDQVKIGNSYLPRFTYAFNAGLAVSGFDLRFLFQGAAGRSVNLLDAASQTETFNNNGNAYAQANGRWAYYPDQGIDTRATATYPRLSAGNNINNYQRSTFWMRNGNFLRLRNVELGYSLPKSLMKRTGLNDVRFYVNGVNLLTFSGLLDKDHMDPESMMGYPALKSVNFGFTVNF